MLVVFTLYGIKYTNGRFFARSPSISISNTLDWVLFYGIVLWHINCYGDISYHTPKMDTSNLNIFAELSSLGEENFSFRTRHLTSRERLILPLYDFLFSANTITFTYYPLFELFFHRSYLKTTTSTIIGHCQNFFIHIYPLYRIWFGRVLWHLNHYRLFNAKSSLYIYISTT